MVYAHTAHNRIVYAAPAERGSGYEKMRLGRSLLLRYCDDGEPARSCVFFFAIKCRPCGTWEERGVGVQCLSVG
ncbi:hypothetical protein FACS189487_06110 [Campylobacterota bacterium]|nr:hypothetical protein FACS189487_06110 [Campylobacterota bacterium]